MYCIIKLCYLFLSNPWYHPKQDMFIANPKEKKKLLDFIIMYFSILITKYYFVLLIIFYTNHYTCYIHKICYDRRHVKTEFKIWIAFLYLFIKCLNKDFYITRQIGKSVLVLYSIFQTNKIVKLDIFHLCNLPSHNCVEDRQSCIMVVISILRKDTQLPIKQTHVVKTAFVWIFNCITCTYVLLYMSKSHYIL